MAEFFRDEEGAAEIFHLMAQDESDHARTLKQVKENGNHSEQIHDSAAEFSRSLMNLMAYVSDQLKGTPNNLDETWLFACDLERSEVNEVYLKLTAELSDLNGPNGDFIAKHVNNHIQRLRELGRRYDAARRRSILPAQS
jgi:rubrerythrin